MDITPLPDITPQPAETVQPRASLFKIININIFWLANQFHWNALISIVIPSMIAKLLDPGQQDINLPLVIVWGTFAAVFVNPLSGAISDHLPFRLGRRRPFMIIGTIINVLVLLAFALTPQLQSSTLLWVMALLFFLLQSSNNFANAPWSAIIADQIQPAQRGFTAGINGLALLLGTALGAVVAGQIVNKHDALPIYRQEITLVFLIIAIVQTLGVLYTCLVVKEKPVATSTQIPFKSIIQNLFFKPSRYPDLAWIFLARLLVMMGIWGIFYFLQYYADAVLHVVGEQFVSVFQPLLLVAALPTSLLAGWISDRWQRKGLVYISGFMMTIVCLLFIFWQSTTGAYIAAIFFGIGYGAYTSVDWALVTDALPATEEAGKFLGLWTAMGILPQVLGTLLSGLLLQVFHQMPNHLGYTLLFIVTIVYFVVGTIAITRVKGVK